MEAFVKHSTSEKCGPNLKDLGEPTQTLVPCWMPKHLPSRNECTGCYAPTNIKCF